MTPAEQSALDSFIWAAFVGFVSFLVGFISGYSYAKKVLVGFIHGYAHAKKERR